MAFEKNFSSYRNYQYYQSLFSYFLLFFSSESPAIISYYFQFLVKFMEKSVRFILSCFSLLRKFACFEVLNICLRNREFLSIRFLGVGMSFYLVVLNLWEISNGVNFLYLILFGEQGFRKVLEIFCLFLECLCDRGRLWVGFVR